MTTKGKEFANRFDTSTKKYEKQAKLCVLVIPLQKVKGSTKILGQKRLKQPFFGYWGFVTGKCKWGETIYETAARDLLEETGLQADLELIGIEHKMDYSEQGVLLDDKYFYVFKANNSSGKLKATFDSSENVWMKIEELLNVEELFDDVATLLSLLNKDEMWFVENKYTTKGF